MATMNFSVPEDVKNRFNQVFRHENRSHLITKLMEKAIEDYERIQRRTQAIDALLKIRVKQKPVSNQFQLLLTAANKGHRRAMKNAAIALDKGDGVDKDQHKALFWYRKAAAAGDQGAFTRAQYLEKKLSR
jgi:TPR repeat protein